MPTYSLVKYEKLKDTNNGGRVLRLALKNGDGQLLKGGEPEQPIFPELYLAKDQPDPQLGAQIDGDVSYDDQFKCWKFKAQRGRGGGGKGWGGGGSPKSPEERASIEAQTAAKIAGEIVVELAKADKLAVVNDPTFAGLFDRVVGLAFDAIHGRAKP